LNGSNTGIASPTFQQCWTLDPTGNWRGFNESTNGTSWALNQTRAANTVNEITGITNILGTAWVNPAYDPAGNMTTMPQPGNPGSSYIGTYDAWNRLVFLKDGASNVQQNQYDARNFRTVILTYAAGVLSETRHAYFTSVWQNIEERTGTVTTADKQFVWGMRYIDDLILRDLTSERLYVHQDANWNVTSISNTAGSTEERYAYTAYGTPSFLTSSFDARSVSSYTWETLFCGYRYDSNARIFNVRFRVYHPGLGVWLTRDPLDYSDGMNLSAALFVPRGVDPLGLFLSVPYQEAGIDGCVEITYDDGETLGVTTIPVRFGYEESVHTSVVNALDIPRTKCWNSWFVKCPPAKLLNYRIVPCGPIVYVGVVPGPLPMRNTPGFTPRAARRYAMRQTGVPTSQQPCSQTSVRTRQGTPVGRQYTYEIAEEGGGTQVMSVQHSLSDDVPGHGPHGEAGPIKPEGVTDSLGRPRLKGPQKVKVDEQK
jgi:RHS repeat-associated protein